MSSVLTKAIRAYILLCTLATLLPGFAFAQGMYTTFGQNRVQHTKFVWSFVRSENFDAFFYSGGRELATFTAKTAEEQLNQIEKALDHRLNNKIEIICYNTLQDLKTANFGLQDQPVNIGGVTQVSNNRFYVYFNGNHGDLVNQIKKGLAVVLINELLFGGSIQERVQNAALLNLPDWFLLGLSSYLAETWNTEYDNKMKDLVNSGKLKKFNRLVQTDALLAGHSFWKFLVEKYGEDLVANVLYITRLSRNYETALTYVVGEEPKKLMKDWLQYYKEQYAKEDQYRTLPIEEFKVKKRLRPYIEPKLRIAPKGDYITYTTNRSGKYKVWLVDTKTGKTKKVHKGGIKYYQNEIDHSFPIIAWHPGGEKFSYIHEKKGKVYLTTVDLITKKKEKILFLKFDKIVWAAYADNGRTLVLSAIRKGQSDLFLYDIPSRKERQITNDPFDDLYPSYAGGSSYILFSSNRNSDSLGAPSPMTLPPDNNLDVYVYDLEKIGQPDALKRLSKTPGIDETHPLEYNPQFYSYLTEYNGIVNRYAVRVEEQYDYTELRINRNDSVKSVDTLYYEALSDQGKVFEYNGRIIRLDESVASIDTIIHNKDVVFTYPLTNYTRSILAHDICKQNQTVYDFILTDTKYSIKTSKVVKDVEGDSKKIETYPNMFRLKTGLANKPFTPGPVVFKPRGIPGVVAAPEPEKVEVKKEEPVDTLQYFFVSEFTPKAYKPEEVKPSFQQVVEKPQARSFKVSAPKFYNVTFFSDQLTTQLDNSVVNTYYQPITPSGENLFNPGLNGMFKLGLMDLFEDHRIVAGVRIPLDFSGADYFLSYENLKRRLDHKVSFYRQVRNGVAEGTNVRSTSHEIRYMIKYPFSPVWSIRLNTFGRMDRDVFQAVNQQTLLRPDKITYWAGYKAELVFDNAVPKGLNLWNGTRFKLFYERYHNLEDRKIQLNVLGFDFRHYQPVHRQIIFCTRLTYNTSFGPAKVKYVLGGVDNWLFASYDEGNNSFSTENYAFQALATNMRGFKQNIRNGSSFAVLNTELRIPIISYIANRPLRSEFLNNFMIVPFLDVGTAWSGSDPYSDDNTFNQKLVEVKYLKVTVINVREPIVAGYGGGLRTRIFGYYVRFDVGWGIQDREFLKKPVYAVSLSMDF